jgi:small conductance mechanosensitive channel
VTELLPQIKDFLPFLIVLLIVTFVLAVADRILIKRTTGKAQEHVARRQLAMITLTVTAIVALILALPVEDSVRNELLGLLGIVLTGIIAFSSTTFVSNIMAGLMLRSVKSFRPGDFIQSGDYFGKVTELSLFHTEIQSEDRDLITLPNLFLASNPVKVVRSSGTALHCELSLGYDVPHGEVERCLKEAALSAGLEDPFVQILELGDFSVTYRAAGFSPDVEHLLSVRSAFKAAILDTMHGAGIEIVSPTFMNQRVLSSEKPVIAEPGESTHMSAKQIFPETLLFDKADRLKRIEMLQSKIITLEDQVKALNKSEADPDIKQKELQQLAFQQDVAERLLAREKEKDTEE